jgi:hypothetical protein
VERGREEGDREKEAERKETGRRRQGEGDREKKIGRRR